MIVSPIMALYKWPRVINFGAGVEPMVDVTAVVAGAALFWHNPMAVAKEKTQQLN
jgi:hypothetical protein